MIFVTVGSQLPFDRLTRAVDEWSRSHTQETVFVQVGVRGYRPRFCPWAETLDAEQFDQRVQDARVIVSHAGTGSIITALQRGKPVIVMPRRAHLRETRNDHQYAMALRLRDEGLVRVVFDASDLATELEGLRAAEAHPRIPQQAPPKLVGTIRRFIESGADTKPYPSARALRR